MKRIWRPKKNNSTRTVGGHLHQGIKSCPPTTGEVGRGQGEGGEGAGGQEGGMGMVDRGQPDNDDGGSMKA
jgi:hypothetical protein